GSPIILDQDPSAVVLVYSQIFWGDGKMTEMQYASLLERLLQIEETLLRWRCPRTVLCLDAPAEVLHRRVAQRCGESRTPPITWFERVRARLLDIFARFPNALAVSTVDLSPEQVISRARLLVEDKSQV